MSETSWMPQGEIPPKFQIQAAFFAASYFGHQKTGETFLPESSCLISTAKDWSCEGVFSIKLRSVISEAQFFWLRCLQINETMREKELLLGSKLLRLLVLIFYGSLPYMPCRIWVTSSGLEGSREFHKIWLAWKNMWLGYTGHQDGWGCTVVVYSRLEGRSDFGQVLFGGTSYSNLDDNKCGVPLDKKKCWNIEYTEHHVIFENEYIISIWDRSASHMVPYVISVVAYASAPWIYWKPQNTIPTWHTRDLLSISGWRHVCPCGHWLAGGAAQRVGSNRCTHPGLICWGYNPPGSPSFPFPRW